LKKVFILILVTTMLAIGAMVLGACSSTSNPTSNTEIAVIRAYADPATQTTLEGLSENNLAKYTQNADAQFKAAVTQEMLDKTSAQINSQLGTFVSITYLSTEKQGEYTIVHYKAKYSNDNVGIKMVFDQDHLVAGQWFE
jgi:hypothetical protein